MNILLLGETSKSLIKIIENKDDIIFHTEKKISIKYVNEKNIDFIVSFGYRFIIKPELIEFLKDRIFNIHISYLPWNRGADPNFWSLIKNTPKGVTLHYIDKGVDTGDIVDQCQFVFDYEHDTLKSTYEVLTKYGVSLFKKNWPFIREGKNKKIMQSEGGSFHKVKDKDNLLFLIEQEHWNTPIKKLIDYNYE